MATFKAKICVVGPAAVGKTVLSNFLSEPPGTRPKITQEYKPTKGVRILEMTVDNLSTPTGGHASVDVELWDCAGAEEYEVCWPAMSHGLHGLVIVVSPNKPSGQSNTILKLYQHFIKLQGLRPSKVIAFANFFGNSQGVHDLKLPSDKLRVVECHLEEDPDGILLEFRRLLNSIVSSFVKQAEAGTA